MSNLKKTKVLNLNSSLIKHHWKTLKSPQLSYKYQQTASHLWSCRIFQVQTAALVYTDEGEDQDLTCMKISTPKLLCTNIASILLHNRFNWHTH